MNAKTGFGAMLAAGLLLMSAMGVFGAGAEADEGSAPSVDPALAPEVLEDRIIVGFEHAVPQWFADWLDASDGEVYAQDDVLDWVAVRLPDAATADRAMGSLKAREGVRFVEHDALDVVQVAEVPRSHAGSYPPMEPDDPFYGIQWGFPAIHAPEAWGVQTGSHDVKVAMLDTGVMADHPDLQANLCGPHVSFVPGESPLEDGMWHGSHVMGSLAAVTDNGIGVAGTAQVCVMSVQVCDHHGLCPRSGSIPAVRWAADNGADVISMSFAGGPPSEAFQEALAYAYEQDVLLVAAAGNGYCAGPGSDTVQYPARFDEVIAVAALRSPGLSTAVFSSCGPAVELSAPGLAVYSTFNHGGYEYKAGTSMATPHVSGVAALLLSEHPDLSAAQVRCVLARTSDDILQPAPDIYTGWGRVNALSAVTLGVAPPSPDPIWLGTPDPQHLLYLAANSCTGPAPL